MTNKVTIVAIRGIPEIGPGDNVASLIARAIRQQGFDPQRGDVFVIAQKIVSKSEGRVVPLNEVEPSGRAIEWARSHGKDPRVVEVVLRESVRIIRMERGVLIAETRHGLVCANAGVDTSNAPEDSVVLLPDDPDGSASRIRATLETEFGVRLGCIVSDTFGRPWREGLVNVAIGVSGLDPLIDYRGQRDAQGRVLRATVLALGDEVASAAELVMGKSAGIPVAVVRGLVLGEADGSARSLIRARDTDLFR